MDDAISREQAIKATWQDTGYTDPFNVMTAIRDRIKQLPPIQLESHWIPVTERLPETDDEVLTTYIVNGDRENRYVETSSYYFDGFSGYWSSPWDEYRIAGTRIEVIAWMPLPEAFKGVTE